MPVFSLGIGKKQGGSGVGILADQLAILENDLGRDGYYGAGDYDILISKARDLANNPSLTADQRSNYQVKISQFEKDKSIAGINSTEDLTRINRNLKSEAAEDVMVAGNNPAEFLSGRIASLQSKLADLSDIIERKQAAGDDFSEYQNDYQETLQQYQSKVSALTAIAEFDGTNPLAGYAAYVTTNNKGEIVDVDYDVYSPKSGYAETNGMMNGFKVYAKPNYKNDGKNYFVMGNILFSGVDMVIPDPNNPGAYSTSKLMANADSKNGISTAQNGYLNIIPDQVRTQGYIPSGAYAKGPNGSIYKRNDDGTYAKYINGTEKDLGISENDIIRIPSSLEKNIGRYVNETIDVTMPITPDEGDQNMANAGIDQMFNFGQKNPFAAGGSTAPAAASPLQTSNMNNPTPSADQMGQSTQARRTPQKPSTAAPSAGNFTQVARRTIGSAVNSVRNLFS